MAFTAGSVELARAQSLANKLLNLHNAFGLTTGGLTSGPSGRDLQLIEKLARNGRFAITGFTTGNGFPPFLTNGRAGLNNSNNHPTSNASGILLGNNTGYTLGIASIKWTGGENVIHGVSFGLTFAPNLQGFTASISILAGSSGGVR